MDKYIVKNGKKLRYGYTTGSCAAAAAKAATFALFHDNIPQEIEIDTPKGWPLKLPIAYFEKGEDWSSCGIKKDGGDDPDVTDGLIIYCKAERAGIGIVTKPGLQIKPGEPAINPVPRAMIKNEVCKVLPEGCGVRLTISIPGGEEVAERTFNPMLGIKGGLSIIGTTGIVEPMSTEALKDTLAVQLSILAAQGHKKVILVPGNYGKNYALKSGENPELIVSYGNYLGFALEKVVEYGFKDVLLIGDIGKLIKVAAGIFDTTGKVADARSEIMTAYAACFGVTKDVAINLLNSVTTREALNIIEKAGIDMESFSKFIAERIVARCMWYTGKSLDIGVKIFSLNQGFLAKAHGKGENSN
ncbi:putative cobalt-precorrin-6A synthase [deacetylating] [Tepidanaerobacter acetatoxydans Re1]|uniref:Cobalt-precorrin-5B C(1)-methyltransferase n=1 Tax=Tepidanaerobacter acetatoxydans (strain DSM 21804 / JCM 16047 / Re1) TaxID=1209989 RepID=F4LUT3_TEPAE|nr:cobalt-precorrin-5B (C(1))-methyltransferase CbiD [Tepidanaerobacter acetatoxydans]AEE90651.1 cobalt-precorrin-6A synthase (deacetylating) [Tepidanaerobacter acetatoxydans Re1]CCP25181.1 putative cobalt-precorrin-6A synthase [deacetylating] [Tepidanaerobacter acetatoxydans Re1]